MKYLFNDPARPVDFKESPIVAALKKGRLVSMPKADGVRMHFIINDRAQLFIRSRADIPFPAMHEIEATLNQESTLHLRQNLVGVTIECEAKALDTDGNELPCEKTSGALQRLEQRTIGSVRLYHFDTYSEGIKGLPKTHRLCYETLFIGELLRRAFHVVYLRTSVISSMEDLWATYEAHREKGFEGSVVVKAEEPYTNGKKVGAGWKVKPDVTVEGTITGLVEAVTPEGKRLGRVGSFEVTFEDGSKGTPGAGAMGFDERTHCWENPEETIGRLAEFKAMERFAKGGYRHPNWKMWRDTLANKGVKQ